MAIYYFIDVKMYNIVCDFHGIYTAVHLNHKRYSLLLTYVFVFFSIYHISA
jgi:hypothetical protein